MSSELLEVCLHFSNSFCIIFFQQSSQTEPSLLRSQQIGKLVCHFIPTQGSTPLTAVIVVITTPWSCVAYHCFSSQRQVHYCCRKGRSLRSQWEPVLLLSFLQVPQSTLVLEPQCHNHTRSLISCLEHGAYISSRSLLTACLSGRVFSPLWVSAAS